MFRDTTEQLQQTKTGPPTIVSPTDPLVTIQTHTRLSECPGVGEREGGGEWERERERERERESVSERGGGRDRGGGEQRE